MAAPTTSTVSEDLMIQFSIKNAVNVLLMMY